MDSRFGTLDREVVKMKNEKFVELVEVKELKVFGEPHEMYVWDGELINKRPVIKSVCAIIPYRYAGSVITTNGAYEHCAEIQSFRLATHRLATQREVARWLAKGLGEVRISQEDIHSYYNYSESKENDEFIHFKVRKWEDTEWHEATIEYLGIK